MKTNLDPSQSKQDESVILSSEQHKEMIVEALDDNKALDIKVLDISEISTFADFMVVASGTSSTHIKSIANNAKRELSRKGLNAIGQEGEGSSEWVLLDFGNIVVHVMRPEAREFYDLEQLWDKDLRKVLDEKLKES